MINDAQVLANLAANMKAGRNRMGLSQNSFAKVAGVSTPLIANYETERVPTPSLLHVLRIARALGLSLEQMIADPIRV